MSSHRVARSSPRLEKTEQYRVKACSSPSGLKPAVEEACWHRDMLLTEQESTAPKAARVLDVGFNDITVVFSLPPGYRKRLRTSNSIERLREEVKVKAETTRQALGEAA